MISYLKGAGAQHLAINESGTSLHGGASRIWIVCVMPDHTLAALYDEMHSGKWGSFPQKTVGCGNVKKPKWTDLKNAMQSTKYGSGVWMHIFSRYWLIFNGEWGSLSSAMKLFKGEIPELPKKKMEKNDIIKEVIDKARKMSSIIDHEGEFKVIPGRKWIRIDYYSGGGRLMVDKKSGDIYEIRGYLKVDIKRKVGNVFKLSAN